MVKQKKINRTEHLSGIVKTLTKKYYLKITADCIELSPLIEDSFEVRKLVIDNLKKAVEK